MRIGMFMAPFRKGAQILASFLLNFSNPSNSQYIVGTASIGVGIN